MVRIVTHIVRVKTPKRKLSDEFEDGSHVILTERVSNSPSGEYKLDTISCLHNGWSLFTKIEGEIGLVRDRGGSTTQVHRHKYLRPILPRDETAPDHGLYDEDANNGQ